MAYREGLPFFNPENYSRTNSDLGLSRETFHATVQNKKPTFSGTFQIKSRNGNQRSRKAELVLVDKYLSITKGNEPNQAGMSDPAIAMDPAFQDHYLNIENFYMEGIKTSGGRMGGFQLKAGSLFLEIYSSDNQTAESAVGFLAKYCIRTNFLENYKLQKNLDKGGFAIVYLGTSLVTNQKFAIKMVEKSKIKTKRNYVGSESKAQLYMINEINLMRSFNHSSLAALYEVYDIDNYLAMVMEYMNKGNLSQRLARAVIPEKQAFHILRSVLEGVQYMHSRMIIHRDIKPGNIMFRDPEPGEGTSEVVKLIDFGLCASLIEKGEEALIHDKSGTVGYLAPEIITKEGKHQYYDDRVDVFSAGICFYEMLTGVSPFKAATYKDAMFKNYVCELNYEIVPASLETVRFIKRMVSKDPNSRFRALEALDNELFMSIEFDEHPANQENVLAKLREFHTMQPYLKTLADKKLQDEKISSAFELKYLVGADFRYEEPQTQDGQTKSGISNGLLKQNSATGIGMSGNSNGLFNGGKHDRDNPNSATRPMSQFTINSNTKAPDLFQRGISQKSQYFMKPSDAGYEGEENIDFSDEDNTLVSIRNRTSLKVRTVGLKSNPLSKKH